MPILQYKCVNCNEKFEELVQQYDAEVKCPKCGAAARRDYSGSVYSATGTKSKHCGGNCKTCGGCR